ncbi:MAG: nuclear transport factor 2 family protein [Sphingobium sp.]|nr:nuclear transport factor 2 family protein [Sphingobium sp.]
MIAASQTLLETYFKAFDEGDTSGYASFYASDVTLQNGAGEHLKGVDDIVAFYEKLRPNLVRTTHVRLVIEGEKSIAALLESRFEVTAESAVFSGDTVRAGDRIQLKSMALYELSGTKFQRITARTIEKNIIRRGNSA